MTAFSPETTAILAHGKNWELPVPADPDQIKLSLESEMTAEAAGLLFMTGAARRIIMSTGYTAGPQYPSEAAALETALRRRFDESKIPHGAILKEEQSYDTVGNLRRVREICHDEGIEALILLSVGYHLPRVKRIARILELPVIGAFRSDGIVGADRGIPTHYYARTVLRAAMENEGVAPRLKPVARAATSYAMEGLAWGATLLDPHAQEGQGLSQKVLTVIRHQRAA